MWDFPKPDVLSQRLKPDVDDGDKLEEDTYSFFVLAALWLVDVWLLSSLIEYIYICMHARMDLI